MICFCKVKYTILLRFHSDETSHLDEMIFLNNENNSLSLPLILYSTLLKNKDISAKSIRDFKTRYVLIIKHVSTSKETLGALGKSNNFLKYAFSSYKKMTLTKRFKTFHVSHN